MHDGTSKEELQGIVLTHSHPTHQSRFACDRCLEFVAGYIAKSMNYSLTAAESHDADWYQQEVGSDVCSPERAADLRGMVIIACMVGGVN